MKIDTSNWKEFRVGDLFEQKRGKEPSPNRVPDGDMPMINETSSNNGLAKYGDSKHILKGNAITVSVNYASTVFYQEHDFIASVNILVLYNENLNPKNALFICTVLRKAHANYNYTYKISRDRLNDEIILLPATQTGEPDWDYMENYMTKIMEETEKKLDTLKKAENVKPHVIDTSQWGTFKIKDFFEIYHGKRLKKEDRIPGNLPLVTAGETNQGVAEYIGNDWPTYENPITIDMFGNCFCHDGIFTGDDNVYFLINHNLSEHIKLYITTIISKTLEGSYGYESQFRQKDADNLTIKLPVTPTGEPDWQYMESYMAKVMKRCDEIIERFKKLQAESK